MPRLVPEEEKQEERVEQVVEAADEKSRMETLLRDRGLSAYELCKQSGVSEKTIRKVKKGEGPVRMATVRRLADALNMAVADLRALLEEDGIAVGTAK